MTPDRLDYPQLLAGAPLSTDQWHSVVRARLVDPWLAAYDAATAWESEVLEIDQGALTFLVDAAPTTRQLTADGAETRVVAVWGRSTPPAGPRDRNRMAGFLPVPSGWSGRGLDRGHLVAHAAGGELDLNLFPQGASLNRGRSDAGRRWRSLEQHVARNPGTPLFVRLGYDGGGWTPSTIDYGLVIEGVLRVEHFANVA
jgi:hypothetical protein